MYKQKVITSKLILRYTITTIYMYVIKRILLVRILLVFLNLRYTVISSCKCLPKIEILKKFSKYIC